MKTAIRSLLVISLILLVSGCADHVTFLQAQNINPVGFWYGLWHGMIIPLSWFFSLFEDSIAIYAIYNNGGWYDFGFALGCGALIGSGTQT